MRGETLLFLPMAGRLRITDEFQQHTYGTIVTETIPPDRPHRLSRHRFHLEIELPGGGIVCRESFADLGEAQARAEQFLRAYGQLGRDYS
ncbi:hypothetical protein [Magnetospirillum sp. UT-4]|uniref:hypothetical protein n=1 Tax=Magnetospirillum sp. UT-4 TaxID=2681467 RepID=UPI00137D7275|nr:hypothetical protein [Magnetospirillum sp. UT-4]CAA7618752.1 hypothetical protein MTBUT4_30179 [Magnetospirillum sp. UT-4]